MENETSSKTSEGSSNGAKKNWRERLGINKDLPKIAAEFREERQAPPQGSSGSETARPASAPSSQPTPRTGQTVATPAPMAPRPSSIKPPLPSRPAAPPRAETPRAEPPRPAPVAPQRADAPDVQASQDDFSARLRAQREAAERLAQQRLAASRKPASNGPGQTVRISTPPVAAKPVPASEDTAEDLIDDDVTPQLDSTPEEVHGAAAEQINGEDRPADASTVEAALASRPKFTFAPEEFDEEPAQAEAPASAPEPRFSVEPEPRRSEIPPMAPPVQQPPMGRQPSQPLRPTLPSDRQPAAPGTYPPNFTNAPSVPASNAPPLQAPNRPVYPQGAQPAAPAPAQEPPRLQARPQRPIDYVDDDLEDVFEDTRRARAPGHRASIDDYNAAYRDYDDAYDDEDVEERRSGSGPIILILALLTVAAIAGALVYFYRTNVPGTAETPENVPVISGPDKPVKSEPDQTVQPAQPTQPVGRKQIYDRILGEETVEPETVVPSEEVPQTPSVVPQATPEPSGSEIEPLPLPLPPPPGASDQQGSLSTPSNVQTVARSTQSQIEGAAGLPTPGTTGLSGRSDQEVIKQAGTTTIQQTATPAIPPPEPLSEAAGAVAAATEASEPAAVNTQTPSTEPSATTTQPATAPATSNTTSASSQPTPPLPRSKPSRRVAAVTQSQPQFAPTPAPQPAPTQPSTSTTGPVVLAPQPIAPAPAPAPAPAQQPQSESSGFQLPNLFQETTTTRRSTGGRLSDEDPLAGIRNSTTGAATTSSGAGQQLTALPAPQPTLPTTLAPAPAPAPTPAPTQPSPALVAPTPQPAQTATPTSTGYVVQLASYRSQGEAENEFQRLRSRHSGLIGNLQPRIQKAELGAAGTFYRLGVGPLSSKQSASNLCNSLIASGEKDCLVRRQ